MSNFKKVLEVLKESKEYFVFDNEKDADNFIDDASFAGFSEYDTIKAKNVYGDFHVLKVNGSESANKKLKQIAYDNNLIDTLR